MRTLPRVDLFAVRRALRPSSRPNGQHIGHILATYRGDEAAGQPRTWNQVEAYLGLVPSERSSGEKQRKGPITKAGNERVLGLRVQVALWLLWGRTPDGAPARMGRTDCRQARQEDSRGGAGATAGWNPLRDDARWDGVPPAEASRAGGRCMRSPQSAA
ncbi:transposase [Pyxidicoccus xibeiensis]|uniref:transposase n=1 Tax=Pyxidicoccus xibeiensis TaxID=2906759 RepID=UPI003899CCCD